MSPASTQRLTAIGTLCRRPSVLLLPLSPFVLLAFAGILIAGTVRAAFDARSVRRSSAQLSADSSAETVVVAEPVLAAATTTTFFGRGASAIRPTPRRALGGAAAILGGVLVAAAMAGGTYAFLNAQATIPAVTVKSGNLALTVQYGSGAAGATTAIPTTAWASMLPGDFVGQQFTLTSTGSAAANVTARLAGTTPWDIRVVAGTCPTTQLTGAPLGTTAVAYGQIPAGLSTVVCVQATLPAGAAASVEATTANFSLVIDATQVPSS